MPKPPASNALAHLDAAQVEELIRRYSAGDEPVAALLAAYGIHCRANDLHRLFPPQTLESPRCEHCGGALIEHLRPRYAPRCQERQVLCTACGHQPFNRRQCGCAACSQRRVQEELVHRLAIRDAIRHYTVPPFKDGPPARRADDLSLWEAFALLCLVRSCNWYSETVLNELARAAFPLTPEDSLTQDLMDALWLSNLIYPDPSSPESAFLIRDYQIVQCNINRVRWRIGASNPAELVREIEAIARSKVWPAHWHDGLEPTCRRLALAECRQFARFSLRQRGMGEPGETALQSLIENLLCDYSVSQINRVLWYGARSASDFLVRKDVSRQHAANFFVGSCQRWADRARAEGWEVKPFGRNFELPRTQLSYVVYDVFLQLGDIGFDEAVVAGFGQQPDLAKDS